LKVQNKFHQPNLGISIPGVSILGNRSVCQVLNLYKTALRTVVTMFMTIVTIKCLLLCKLMLLSLYEQEQALQRQLAAHTTTVIELDEDNSEDDKVSTKTPKPKPKVRKKANVPFAPLSSTSKQAKSKRRKCDTNMVETLLCLCYETHLKR
ncbi:hypothetical protein BDR26DRAFT_949090, partial [Obelidium mucronatum]